jgi:LysR family transcriptional regulator for bpeEF and oprC
MIPKLTTNMLDLGDLRLFLKAAQLSSLSGAGRALGIPRASASRQLQRLEAALDCRLVHRDARNFSLTEEGRTFLPLIRQALASVDEAAEAVLGQGGALSGVLRIAAPYTYGRTVLTPIIAMFAQRHPGLAVSVELGSRHVDLFRDEADVAIRIGAVGAEDLIARRLGTEVMILVAAPAYLSGIGPIERAEDLGGLSLLDYRLGSPSRDLELFDGEMREEVRIIPRFVSNEPGLLVDAAKSGLGIAIAPLSIAAAGLADGSLQRVLPHLRSSKLEVHALYAPGRHQSRKIRAFLDHAVSELGSSEPQ